MHVAVTAVGVDRPGIVAAVTKVLYAVGGNIEDSRMAILGGHFAMVLIVALPDGADPADLERALDEPARARGLIASVRPVAEAPAEHDSGAPYVVSVYGADHPGIVARVSETLAELGVNITDLATHVIPGSPPVYVMLLEVSVPGDAAAAERALGLIAGELGVDISMRPNEAETL